MNTSAEVGRDELIVLAEAVEQAIQRSKRRAAQLRAAAVARAARAANPAAARVVAIALPADVFENTPAEARVREERATVLDSDGSVISAALPSWVFEVSLDPEALDGVGSDRYLDVQAALDALPRALPASTPSVPTPRSRPRLTPYDTGERLEPVAWTGAQMRSDRDYGRVDFDNEEGGTVLTAHVQRDPDGGYALHVESADDIRVVLEG